MTTYHLIHAGASFIVSLASFIVFTVFNNSFGAYHGAMAATADGFSFAVIYFYRCEIVEEEERRSTTENCIKSLSIYGFLILLLNFVQFIFRLIMQLRNEPAIFPISNSNLFDIIVCLIGFKSGICLIYYCLWYRRRGNDEERQPLLVQNN